MPQFSHIRVDRISHSFGDRPVLCDLSLAVGASERLGLIGENGAGKSTLLSIMAGVIEPLDGVVTRPDRTGILWQEVRHSGASTIEDLIETALADVRAIAHELADAGEAIAGGAEAEERYSKALEQAERADLWRTDARVAETIAGLALDHIPTSRRLDELSGGQRSRFALAALLIERPTALLLDEPTNHLDDASVDFLRDTLRTWNGPVVFASHDRAFLDEVATSLLDIDPARAGVTRFGGGYSDYLLAKAAERARWEQQFAEEGSELARLEQAVGTTARDINHDRPMRDKNKMAFGMRGDRVEQQISRRIQNAQARLDYLTDTRVSEPAPALTFAGIPKGSHILDREEPLITVEGAVVSERLTLDEFRVEPREYTLITGANGSGKSTMLWMLAGRLAPQQGAVRRQRGVRTALLEQDVRFADPNVSAARVYEVALGERRAETVPLATLGLLGARDLDRPVGQLSIGQQRRLALALIIAKPPHVFLLDEPANHLSLALATELEDALGSYPGAVIVASHDRWLRGRWQGAVVALDNGRIAA
ncbi:MAG: ABC-F family ATP-binding cassette domain-containing protein [Rhodoglobus sp.]